MRDTLLPNPKCKHDHLCERNQSRPHMEKRIQIVVGLVRNIDQIQPVFESEHKIRTMFSLAQEKNWSQNPSVFRGEGGSQPQENEKKPKNCMFLVFSDSYLFFIFGSGVERNHSPNYSSQLPSCFFGLFFIFVSGVERKVPSCLFFPKR